MVCMYACIFIYLFIYLFVCLFVCLFEIVCVHVLVSLESISTCFAPPQLMDPVSWFDFNLNTLTTQQGHFDGHRHGLRYGNGQIREMKGRSGCWSR